MHNRKLLNIELGRVTAQEYRQLPESGLVLVLDNIRSAHNVGSAFRTADTFKIDKVWLCGICAVPPSAEIHKSALGAEDSVEWRYFETALQAVEDLKQRGYEVYSVEQAEGSTMLHDFVPQPNKRYAVVMGNEVKGVHQEVIDSSHGCLEIPQFGTKHSMNVSVTAGIIIYTFAQHLMFDK